MLSHFCKGDLHLAFGRGTAKIEYDAYDIDMSSAKERFKEAIEIINHALSGEPFDFEGQFYKVGRRVAVRPKPNRSIKMNFGSIGLWSNGYSPANFIELTFKLKRLSR